MKKMALFAAFLLLLSLIVACRQCGTLLPVGEGAYRPLITPRAPESLLPSLSGIADSAADSSAAELQRQGEEGFYRFEFDAERGGFSFEELRYSPADAAGISRLTYIKIGNGTIDDAEEYLRGDAAVFQYCFNNKTGESHLFGSRKAEYYSGLFEQTILDTSSDESLRRSSYREQGAGVAWFEGGRYSTEEHARFSRAIDPDDLTAESPYIEAFLSLEEPLTRIPYIAYRLYEDSEAVCFDFSTTLTTPADKETWAVNLPQAWYRATEFIEWSGY